MNTKAFSQSIVAQIVVLIILGLLAFFYNLSNSLFGETEGLYGAVTDTMIRNQEYVHLTLWGQPYYAKSPFFFWLQALSSNLIGWGESALRLPSALPSLATVLVTYFLGATLFTRLAGFFAALVLVTSYAMVWFGQMAIIDPILTFCMTLGLLCWARAYFLNRSGWWYVLGFVALALGAMAKTLHAFAMPALLFASVLLIQKDTKPLKSAPFWIGLVVFLTLLGGYYGFLGPKFWQHFFIHENLTRMVEVAGDKQLGLWEAYFGKRPIVWYAAIVWLDLFPWSALLPVSLWLLWQHRPLRQHPREAFVMLWVLGYLIAFSLLPEKHERYLYPLFPGIALMIGYYCHHVFVSDTQEKWATPLFKIMLGLLSLGFTVFVLVGTFLLHQKWHVAPTFSSMVFQLAMIVGVGILVYALYRSQVWLALKSISALAIVLMIGLVVVVVPGIHAVAAPKLVYTETLAQLQKSTDPILTFQHWDWRSDEDMYYWQRVHTGAGIVGAELNNSDALRVLKQRVHQAGKVVLLMTGKQFDEVLSPDSEITHQVLREFYRPNAHILLVSFTPSKKPG